MRLILVCCLLAALAAGCGAAPGGHGLQVVAAENMWGSIAAQLAGGRATVDSIVSSPALDPHDYEPTVSDARRIAVAQLVIVNGAGYDPWATKLVAANPLPGRVVLDVGRLVGVGAGGNPHLWYDPANVRRAAAAITADLVRLEPKDAARLRRLRTAFETHDLAAYAASIAAIRARYAGVPVGASESIFAPLAQALGLRLLTPGSFLNAISEGTEPTAADITTIQQQIARRKIAVWVYNAQNATPDVQRLTDAARRRGIRVVQVTETMVGPTFQAWQVRQLEALRAALHGATGR